MRDWFLGIDTSNYTTSVALVAGTEIIADRRRHLTVPEGQRGLRQSEAVFQHMASFPDLVKSLPPGWADRVAAIAVSTRPRPVEGSYMPVFRAGLAFAVTISETVGCPVLETTHQEGHIRAGLHLPQDIHGSVQKILPPFMCVHVSGGTTELLVCTKSKANWTIELMGGTGDLHAGQFIDRIGVEMGLPFPAGPRLEQTARQSTFALPISVRNTIISFSGPEAAALRALRTGVDRGAVAWAVEQCVADSLSQAVLNLAQQTGLTKVLVVGGVASNRHIRREMGAKLEEKGIGFAAGDPNLSSDNAVGTAFLAQETFQSV